MSRKAVSAFSVESAFVALESLTNSTGPRRPTSSIRCGRPGNAVSPAWICSLESPSARAATATATAAFCQLCAPRSEPMPLTSASAAPSVIADDAVAHRERFGAEHVAVGHVHAHEVGAAPARRWPGSAPSSTPTTARAAPWISRSLIAAYCSMVPWRSRWSGVMFISTPTLGSRRRRQVDLERRHLDHVDALGGGRLQRQDRGADIAAHLDVAARLGEDVGDQRRRGRLAVGAGDRHERRVRRQRAALPAEQLDVADDRDARVLGEPDASSAARDGSAARRARGRAAAKPDQSAARRSCVSIPASCARARLSALSSQARTPAPPACSASAVARPEPPRPNSATASEAGDGVMRLGMR